MVLSALFFVPIFMLNLMHLKYRKIPLYTWGTVIAVFHLCAGFLFFLLIPVAALIVSFIIEVANLMMTREERKELDMRYELEQRDAEENIRRAQEQYATLHCLISYTSEQDYAYRKTLAALEADGIWHFVRGGPLTSVLVRREDAQKACDVLGIDYSPDDKT